MAETEEKTETTEQTETTTDQHGSAMPDGFEEAMDTALKTDETTEEVSEETEEVVDESTDEEIVEQEETTESEDEVVETSEEVKEKPEAAKEPAQEKEPEKPDSVVSKVEELKLEDVPELDAELTDPSIIATVKAMQKNNQMLVEKINSQAQSLAKTEEGARLEREKVYENRIDSCFDTFTEILPELGDMKTTALTEQNGKFRREVFQHAQVAATIHGIPIEDAIQQTVEMFKNRDGDEKAEKRLIGKLQKQKFTNKPTRKKSTPSERKFKNETEEANYVMTEAYKEAGIGN